jgi:hypothetical protein
VWLWICFESCGQKVVAVPVVCCMLVALRAFVIGQRRRLHELRELAPAVLAVASVSVCVAVDERRELRTESGGSDGGLLCVSGSVFATDEH